MTAIKKKPCMDIEIIPLSKINSHEDVQNPYLVSEMYNTQAAQNVILEANAELYKLVYPKKLKVQ